ncbi:sigma-54-dependent Fis family transcriptional regulator [Leekyejoonella antrihumi]|uniref:Sigma-54 factor interaction domain-containing protein n=1 Tax=Leekyejoonella antrihumi TaxID=1660198 RepID=A0A563DZA8_9MICO|nr:helix-turn-helix domain-containing protein [Leekyejoonella antrihumi]TWP35598.1 hypothetical protein FGL98_13555 [Leekyejoonella antrihumi]
MADESRLPVPRNMETNLKDRACRVDRQLSFARDEFLRSGEPLPTLVRGPIQASWARAVRLGLSPTMTRPAYVHCPAGSSRLLRVAGPVLARLAGELSREPVSVVMADSHGRVQQRVCGDGALVRAMDVVFLASGFSAAEDQVGTNGIGTTLEAGVATLVTGHEHFTDELGAFSSGGALIHHPVSRVLIGAVECTVLDRRANTLLMAFASSTAQRIEAQLLEDTSAHERALFCDYLSACRSTPGAVLALNADVVMINRRSQQLFDAADQAALLQRAGDVAGSRSTDTIVVDLPSGLVARMEYRPSYRNADLAGGVVRVHVQQGPERTSHPSAPDVGTSPAALPGLVGMSPIWRRVGQDVSEVRSRGEAVILEGESGVGKVTLARAVHELHSPAGHLRVLDPPAPSDLGWWLESAAAELTEGGGTLVLRDGHRWPIEVVSGLAKLLLAQGADRACPTGSWVVLTLSDIQRNPLVDAVLVPCFSRSIVVPPLRHHIEDLERLVPTLLRRIVGDDSLRLSPAALRRLMLLPWAGNIGELHQVLHGIVRYRRAGVIATSDLPPKCLATARRQLTLMEELQRDAVLESLARHGGNKQAAAEDLGVSRATIYRRIREYGIPLASPIRV